MNKKLSTLVLALGITAAPVFAKQQNNRRAAKKASSGVEERGSDKRAAKSLKRFLEVEAEKEFLKETEEQISEVINYSMELSEESKLKLSLPENEIVHSERIPANGIDITAEFDALLNHRKKE